MNWYRLDGETLSGPYGYYSREVLAATGASNPDCLSDAEMRGYGYIPEWCEAVEAPLGWQAPTVETRDGEQWVAVYAAGTPEARAIESLKPIWAAQAAIRKQRAAIKTVLDDGATAEQRILALKTLTGN